MDRTSSHVVSAPEPFTSAATAIQDTIYVLVDNPFWVHPSVIAIAGSLLVLAVGGAVKEIYSRSMANFVALVRIERLLNKILGLVNDLKFEVSNGLMLRIKLAKESNNLMCFEIMDTLRSSVLYPKRRCVYEESSFPS